MNRRKDQCTHHGKKGHGLRRTIDGRSPLLPEEKKNGRNKRSGMTDSDPENEVDDCEPPADWIIQSPDAYPIPKQVGDHNNQDHQQHIRDAESPPPSPRRLFLGVVGHQLGDLVERRISLNQGFFLVIRHIVTGCYFCVGRIHGRIFLSWRLGEVSLKMGLYLNERIKIRTRA